jgi:HD-GYP domain-containing protein (c-di-GMP phosphodiesterase class II)
MDDACMDMSHDLHFEFAPEESDSFQGAGSPEPTVLAWRSSGDWGDVRRLVVRSDARVAELMLGLVRETAAARDDEQRLADVLTRFAFEAFPNATHHVLVAREQEEAPLRTLTATARSGDASRVPLSRTIVERVLRDGHALLYVHGQDQGGASESIVLSRLETAIVAPLLDSAGRPLGVVQLDVRRPARGRFTRDDMDLLSVFASQAGLALENLWLHERQQRAFQSTIAALVHSLTLKDQDAARHSERVQQISLAICRHLDLPAKEREIVSVAALLHDVGKQGVRDEVLFKPGKLTPEERQEMDLHAAHTQGILDMIEYPAELWDVPRIAAYHHEKIDGTGPFGIPGDQIPLAARIISVADVFDALASDRPYKDALPTEEVLDVLERGRGRDWDPRVIDALAGAVGEIMRSVYADASEVDDDGEEPLAEAA